MINVSEINKNKEITSGAKIRKSAGGESFSAYLKEASKSESAPVSAGGSLSSTDILLAAQMVDADDEKELRRRAVSRGKTLLEKLEEIRDGLLLGTISKDRLMEISRYVRERRINSDDPRLEEIIAEIELRVEVELAKLTK